MTHMYSLYGWLVNGRKGGEKERELQLPGYEVWLPFLNVI